MHSAAWKDLSAKGLAETPRTLGVVGAGLCYNRILVYRNFCFSKAKRFTE